ncbi:MAG TPA: S8 family serine peptidase [Thermoanaerobaculaceae bacterium]|nr:S8 family serine peptidase [Thermoanaerobaculaceae bacterium]
MLLVAGFAPDVFAGVRRAAGDSPLQAESSWPAKLTPALRGRALQPGERLDLLVQLRAPADLAASGPAALVAPNRLRLIQETGDELAREYAPFGGRVVERFRFLPVVRMTIATELLEALASDARVVSIEPVRVFSIQRQNGKVLMNVGPVASLGIDGTGVTVAVLDSGVDYRHPELAPGGTDASAKTIKIWDAIENDDDPMDAEGHGTSVAGIVAGSVDGVAPNARIAAVRVMNAEGKSQGGSVLKGIDKVVESVADGNPFNIRAVNLSLGGLDPDAWPPNSGNCDEELPSYKVAFDTLINSGVLVLAAAGNDGCPTGVAFPACVSSAMAVGAVYNTNRTSRSWTTTCGSGECDDTPAPKKQIACYSNSGDKLAVWAPADCTITTDLQRPGAVQPVMTYCFNGTSAATPYTAGVAALLASAQPGVSPRAIRDALINSGEAITDGRNGISRNLVNAQAALQRLQQGCGVPAAPGGLASNPPALCANQDFTMSWSAVDGAASYTLEASDNAGFTSPDFFEQAGTSIDLTVSDTVASTLYVRVRANVACGSSAWSPNLTLRYTPQCGGPSFTTFVSGIARTPGLAPAIWYSDVAVANPTDVASDLTLTFYGNSGSPSTTARVEAHRQVSWKNVVQGLFQVAGNDVGVLKVESTQPSLVVGRTYSQVTAGSPTYGQEYVGMTPSQALAGGQVGYLANLRSDTGFYSNIELVNVGQAQASVEVKFYESTGAAVKTLTKTVDPNRRVGATSVLPSGKSGVWAEVRVTPAEGKVLVFASVIDDASKDPTTVPLFIPAASTAQPFFVSGIARWPGYSPAVWYSDLGVLNPSDGPVTAQLTFYGTSQTYFQSREIGARQQLFFQNVLQSLFGLPGDDVGALVVTGSGPLYPLARTYSQVSAGSPTYGQGYVGMTPSQALSQGNVGVIAGMRSDTPYYTNLELVNVGSVTTNVEVRFFDNGGAQVGSLTRSVPPNKRVGVNKDKVLPPGTGFAFAELRLDTAGAKLIAFASVVDDLSKDPTTLPMFAGPF